MAFNKEKRRQLLLDTLKRFCAPPADRVSDKWDILALQELDLLTDLDGIIPALKTWGYEVVHTPTDQRRDCCAIVFDKNKFRLVKTEIVRFDDLVTLWASREKSGANNDSEANNMPLKDGTTFNNIKPNRTNSELTGIVRSFLRRNCAILAHLETIDTKQSILASSVHLYWHPGYEYVKLCQAKYLLDRAHAMASQNTKRRIPTLICGDMNSKPRSVVHRYFVKGDVDARSIAPWHYYWDEDDEIMYEEKTDRLDGQDSVEASVDVMAELENDATTNGEQLIGISGLEEQFQFCQFIDPGTNSETKVANSSQKDPSGQTTTSSAMNKNFEDINHNYSKLQDTLTARRMSNHKSPQDYTHITPSPGVKYMLDFTLNRFTRWLRILGIDARLETEDEERERTKGQTM